MSKPTIATVKSLIRKNPDTLLIKAESSFDGMTDGVEYHRGAKFERARPSDMKCENNLGYSGVWIVGGSRNSITEFYEPGFRGFKVYNCCGSFTVAIPVTETLTPVLAAA